MKTIKSLLLSLFLLSFVGVSAQDYALTAPIGYASTVTGGGTPTASNTVTVTTEAGFKSALTGTKSVILVSGAINVSALIKVKVTNKTILGLTGSKLVNLQTKSNGVTDASTAGSKTGIVYFQTGSNNVIIRNLTLEGPGAWDCGGNDGICLDGATNFWIDHCDFQDGIDGNMDMKNATDNISVTWCRFHYLKTPTSPGASWESGATADHRFTDLIGSSSSDKPTNRRITWANCWWDSGCVERMPRSRHSQFHFLNCYWSSPNAKVDMGLGGCKAYIEGCYFTQSKSIIYKDYSSDDGLSAGSNSLTYVNCTGANNGLPANITGMGVITAPTYTYTPMAVTAVVGAVTSTCGAGATLTIDAAGAISTPCSATSPTLVLTSGSTAQTVTAGSAIGSIVYTYGGTAIGATVSGLPTGVAGTVNTTTKAVTIAGTPTVAGTYSYTITSDPTGVALSGTISVAAAIAPTLALTTGTASQTAYTGVAITPIVYTYGGGTTSVTVANLPTGVTATTDAVNKTITITGIPTAAGVKAVTLTTVGGSGSAVVLTNTITVNTPATLAVPTALAATPSATSATITWSPVTNATGYTLNVCDQPTGSGDKILFHETFNKCTVGSVVYDNAGGYGGGKTSGATCAEAGTVNLKNTIIKFTGLNLTGLADAKIMIKYKTAATIGSAAVKVNDEAGSSTNFIYKFAANATLFNFDDVLQATVTPTGTDYIAIRADSGSDITIDEILIYIPGAGGTSTCTEYPISGGTTSSYTVSGLTSGVTYNYQLKATSTNSAYLDGTYSSSQSFTASGTLTPVDATLSLTSAASTATQSIITNNALTSIAYSYTGSAVSVSWTGTDASSNAPSGLTVSTASGVVSISGTALVAGTYGYTITATGIDGGASKTLTGTITVTDPAQIAIPTGVTASATSSSISLNWAAIANATSYTVNLCGQTLGTAPVPMYFNTSGSGTLNTGDIHTASSTSISLTSTLSCTTTGVSTGYRTGSDGSFSLTLVNTDNVSQLVIGAKSSSTSSARTLTNYTVNGGTAITTGFTNSGTAACGEYTITPTTSFKKGDVIKFTFGGNVQVNYYVASVSALTSACTESTVTTNAFTASSLTPNTTYTYQIKANTTSPIYAGSDYSSAQSISTSVVTDIKTPNGLSFSIIQNDNSISIKGLEVESLDIYTISGDKVANAKSSTIGINGLNKGIYIVLVKSTDGSINSKKFIKK